METITLVSQDGETAVVLVKNWKNEGRPAVLVNTINDAGTETSAEIPLDPGIVIAIVNLMQEAEHHMLRFLCRHVAENINSEPEDERPKAPVLSIFKGK